MSLGYPHDPRPRRAHDIRHAAGRRDATPHSSTATSSMTTADATTADSAAREAQDALGDDVLVHLGGTARDGECPHVDAVTTPCAGVGVGTEDLARHLPEVLLGLAP